MYQACEGAKEGKEDSTAGFISRFIQICLRVVCSQPTPTVTPGLPAVPHRMADATSSLGNRDGGANTTMQTSPALDLSALLSPHPSPAEPLAGRAAMTTTPVRC